MQTIYFAGGCLWGVQAFVKTLPGVVATEAGRANGAGDSLEGPYDGYARVRQGDVRRGPRDRDRADGLLLRDHRPLQREPAGAADVGEKYRTASTARIPPTCVRRRPSSERGPTATGPRRGAAAWPATSRAPRSTKTTWTSSPTTIATSPGSL